MLFDTIGERRSIENPSTSLSNPADWLYDALGARAASSGVSINRETALTYAAFWRGVNLISRDVGKLPIIIYRRSGEGKERATEHPAYRLLKRRPNAEMTALVFKQTLQAHALTMGNGYAYIFRRGDGRPMDLVPLAPDKTFPVRESKQLFYVTKLENDEPRKLLPENVLHIKGLSYDGLVGYSVIQMARDSLGLGLGAREFGSRYFKNNARPSVVIEVPNVIKDEAAKAMLQGWNAMVQGIDNAHKAAILTNGAKLNTISNTPEESQLMELRAFEIREIADWLGVPPHKLGDTTRTAFASLEQENQSYLDDALDGWLCNWEAECAEKLLTEQEKEDDSHVIEFLRQALVRADLAARGEYYSKALAGRPWMTQDQVRSLENMNPMGGDAEKLLDPPNTTKGQESGDGADAGDTDEPDDDDDESAGRAVRNPKPDGSGGGAAYPPALVESLRRLVQHEVERMAKRIGDDARRAAKNPKGFIAWLDGMAERHRAVVIRAITAVCGPAAVLSEAPCDAVAMVDAMLADVRESLLNVAGERTEDTLAEGVDVTMQGFEGSLPLALADRVLRKAG